MHESPGRSSRLRIRRAAAAVGVAATAALVAVPAADAQTTIPPLQPITVTVNLAFATPSGVTGYRVDTMCRNVPGAATGELNLSIAFARTGGTGQFLVPLGSAVSCAFRVAVLGSGPRPLAGNSILIGGVPRAVSFPTTLDGAAVDPETVIQTEQIPVTAATTVLIGTPPAPPATTTTTTTTTPTTTTTTTTTVPATTTTTRPATTTAVLVVAAPPTTAKAVVVKPVASVQKRAGSGRKVVSKRVCVKVRNKRCIAYRTVRV
jgi:hypothetical protein